MSFTHLQNSYRLIVIYGRCLICEAVLNDSLSLIYLEPKEIEITTNDVHQKVFIDLQPLASLIITGTVKGTGMAINDADVSVRQWINKKKSTTSITKTDQNGHFLLKAVNDSTQISIDYPGYLQYTTNFGDFAIQNDTINLGSLRLKELNGTTIALDPTYQLCDSAVTTYYSDLSNIDFELYNVSSDSIISEFQVHSNTISTLYPLTIGEDIRISAHSKNNSFIDCHITTKIADTTVVKLPLVQKGRILATDAVCLNNTCTAILYNSANEMVNRSIFNQGLTEFADIDDGEYTLVSMGYTDLLNNVMFLPDLANIGLTEGKDYVEQNVKVEAGKITTVSVGEIPFIDETAYYYTGAKTSFTTNKNKLTAGSYIAFTATLDFKEDYTEATDVKLIIDIPYGCEYVDGSAIYGNSMASCEIENGKLTIILGDEYSQRVRFCFVPTKSGNYSPTALVQFNCGEKLIQPIGNAPFSVEDISLNVPSIVTTPYIQATGITTPHSYVILDADGNSIGGTLAKADGSWSVEGNLINAYNLSTHSIMAHITTPAGIKMDTESRDVEYDMSHNQVKTVTMINTAHTAANLNLHEYVTVFDFIHPANEPPIYWYWPSYPDFTFIIDFLDNHPEKIYDIELDVHLSNGETKSITPEYRTDMDRWVAKDMYNSASLPISVSVKYNCNSESLLDLDYISEIYQGYACYIQSVGEGLNQIGELYEEISNKIQSDKIDLDQFLDYISRYPCLSDMIEDKDRDVDAGYNGDTDDFIEQLRVFLNESEEFYAMLEEEFNASDSLDYRAFLSSQSLYKDEEFIIDDLRLTHTVKRWSEMQAYPTNDFEVIHTTSQDSTMYRYIDSGLEYIDYRNDIFVKYDCEYVEDNRNRSHILSKDENIDKIIKIYDYITSDEFADQVNSIKDGIGSISDAIKETHWDHAFNRLAVTEAKADVLNELAAADHRFAIKYGDEITAINRQKYYARSGFNRASKNLAQKLRAKTSFNLNTKDIGMDIATTYLECYQDRKRINDLSLKQCVQDKYPEAYELILDMQKRLTDRINMHYLAKGLSKVIQNVFGAVNGPYQVLTVPLSMYMSWIDDIRDENLQRELRSELAFLEHNVKDINTRCQDEVPSYFDYYNYKYKEDYLGPYAEYVQDPSGYVYEAVSSNRIENVTATIFQKTQTVDIYGDLHDVITKWDAEPYSQHNPVQTDANGLYAWDVPDGWWQIKFEKDGYETVLTDWLPVPPPQLDINVPMWHAVPPNVAQVRGYESGIIVDFSKYMLPNTLDKSTVTVTRNGVKEEGSIELSNLEKAPTDNKPYVSKVKFVPSSLFDVSDHVVITISREVESYAGMQMDGDFTMTVPIVREIRDIEAVSELTVIPGDTATISFKVVSKEAAAGKKMTVMSSSPTIASSITTEAVIDNDGRGEAKVRGNIPGVAVVTLQVEGFDLTKDVKVSVDSHSNRVKKPTASIPSGLSVPKGTEVSLKCDTKDAVIYYTVDGSCPCDANNRIMYLNPIVIDSDTRILAMAECEGMEESEISEFAYTVIDDSAIEGITTDNLTISVREGSVTVTNGKAMNLLVFGTDARLMKRVEIKHDRDEIKLPDGIYIVIVMDGEYVRMTQKVSIRR